MFTTLRPRWVPNSTAPAARANSVSSPATADARAGVEVGAALADQDLTGVDDLTAEALHAEPLSIGVATVPGGRCALLVCHLSSVPYFAAAGISVTLIAVYCWRWP